MTKKEATERLRARGEVTCPKCGREREQIRLKRWHRGDRWYPFCSSCDREVTSHLDENVVWLRQNGKEEFLFGGDVSAMDMSLRELVDTLMYWREQGSRAQIPQFELVGFPEAIREFLLSAGLIVERSRPPSEECDEGTRSARCNSPTGMRG